MTVRTDRGNEVIDGGQRGPNASRLVHRPTATLRPHPTYQACGGPIAGTRVRRVAQERGPIRESLLTTTAGTILDGHARWQVALDRQQPTLPCIEYDLTEEEALQFVIERHRQSEGLNDFCRIVLGLTSGTLTSEASSRPLKQILEMPRAAWDRDDTSCRAGGVHRGRRLRHRGSRGGGLPCWR